MTPQQKKKFEPKYESEVRKNQLKSNRLNDVLNDLQDFPMPEQTLDQVFLMALLQN